MRYAPLTLDQIVAAIRVHDPLPAQRALLAHALLDDSRLEAIAAARFRPAAEEIRQMLLMESSLPGGDIYRPLLTEARTCGLAATARPYLSRDAIALAESIEAVTVQQLAELGAFEALLGIAGVRRPRVERPARPQKWERDLAAVTGRRSA